MEFLLGKMKGMDESTARSIAVALTPLAIYLWIKGFNRLRDRLRKMPRSWYRSVLLWPSK